MLAATGPATEEPPVSVFPPLPLAEWADTKETVHRFLQVVGKLRLANAPGATTGGTSPSTSPAGG